MFVGHLAVSFGAKAVEPKAPLGALVAASFGLDLLWPLLLLTGLEVVQVAPGNTAFTPLAFESYPWSHSLLMALVWGVVGGTLPALSSLSPYVASPPPPDVSTAAHVRRSLTLPEQQALPAFDAPTRPGATHQTREPRPLQPPPLAGRQTTTCTGEPPSVATLRRFAL